MLVNLGTSTVPTKYGDFEFSAWYDGTREAYSIHKGFLQGTENVPVRVHSSCITSHYFNGVTCDCVEQLAIAQDFVASAGTGIIIVLEQEAKGNGAIATANYAKFSSGTRSSFEVFEKMGLEGDARNYRTAAEIIKFFEIKSINLLSNSPSKSKSLTNHGVTISNHTIIKADNELLKNFYAGKETVEGHKFV